MVDFSNVSKTYPNGTKALKNFNLHIDDGEFVFALGASGAGKSTFLKLIMSEEIASHGEVTVNGKNLNRLKNREIPYYRRGIGMVFQDFRLIPNMRVFDNVAFAMRVIGAKEKDVSKRVAYVLSLVGLSSKAKVYPTQLSGGEQQRVSLARALVNEPAMIIADEPTGNIDPEMSFEIVDLLSHINQNNGTTVIMVTHEHELVKRFDNRIVMIKNGMVVSDTANAGLIPAMDEYIEEPVITGRYYDAPTENVDVEDFLRSYGSDDAQAVTKTVEAVKTGAVKSDDTAKKASGAVDDTGSDIISPSKQTAGEKRFSAVKKPDSKSEEKDFSKYFENADAVELPEVPDEK